VFYVLNCVWVLGPLYMHASFIQKNIFNGKEVVKNLQTMEKRQCIAVIKKRIIYLVCSTLLFPIEYTEV